MKKKFNKNIIWFFDEVYAQEYLVIFAPTHRKFCELVKKEINFTPEDAGEKDDTVVGTFYGISNKSGTLCIIWSSTKTYSLIHECFHACSWVLQNRDIILNPETEETYAYYYTFIYRMIMENVKYNRRKE